MSKQGTDWIADGVSLDRPNPARIYDYLLGGHHNFAADRAAAAKLLERVPTMVEAAVVQRAFLRRVISFMTARGIDQFLDIGSGLPTVGNVHELAQAGTPEANVVYVDIDPVVISHSSELLKDDPRTAIIKGDLRYPSVILEHEETADLLDFDRPLGLAMTAVLHFVPNDDLAYGAVKTLTDVLAPGSYVVITHALADEEPGGPMNRLGKEYEAAENRMRSREEIERFFDGLEMVEPGLVRAPLWRPEGPDDLLLDNPEGYAGLAGVGRKP